MHKILSLATAASLLISANAMAAGGMGEGVAPAPSAQSNTTAQTSTGGTAAIKTSQISTAVTAAPSANNSIAGSAGQTETNTQPTTQPRNILPVAVPVVTPATTTAQPILLELKDGSKVQLDNENNVTVINPDGSKSAAPDGVLTLKNNTTFSVKDGKKLD